MPLHVAVREGHLDLALALLDRGAVIDAVNQVQKLATYILNFFRNTVISVAVS